MLWYRSVCGSAAALWWVLYVTLSSSSSAQRGVYSGLYLIVAPYSPAGSIAV